MPAKKKTREEKNGVTQELLKELFVYDPAGFLIRKSNGRRAGSKNENRPCYVSVGREVYLSYRLIYLLMTGEYPNVIDHINRDCRDDRICNLRNGTNQENSFNRGSVPNSSSKYKGVSWDKARNKWMSVIRFNGVHNHIGRFDDEESGARAYDRKARELFGPRAYLNFPDQLSNKEVA